MGTVILGLVFAAVLAIPFLGIKLARPKPRNDPPDLRRADEAEAQELPTAAELQDRISEAWGQTRPLP